MESFLNFPQKVSIKLKKCFWFVCKTTFERFWENKWKVTAIKTDVTDIHFLYTNYCKNYFKQFYKLLVNYNPKLFLHSIIIIDYLLV